jgi:4-amino-4-deoxy-L-arabinose transferase-like glycosyltransferase
MKNGWRRLSLGRRQMYRLLVLVVLGLGVAVRMWHFPDMPPGLNPDEAASAYEAYSLAETGADRWGNHLPVYFPAWGSGQNVLLAYLTVPVIKVLGLNLWSTRLMPLLLGLLTMPLFFGCLQPLGRRPALLGLLLLALAPWHFMLSRWGLESNLAPFWMLLGCFLVLKALTTQRRGWIIPALLPFALALYAYGTTVVVLPGLLLLLAVGCFRRIRPQARAWALATGLFLVVALPFALFFLENYVLRRNLAWTDNMFFSTPLLLANRLNQTGLGSWYAVAHKNFNFVVRGFDDDTNYNQMLGYPVLLRGTWVLATVGFAAVLYRLRALRNEWAAQPKAVAGFLFLAWGVACLPLFLVLELNINRINHFFLPCLALAAWGAAALSSRLPDTLYAISWGLLLSWFGSTGLVSAYHYLFRYPQGEIRTQFNDGLASAFAAVSQLQGAEQVLITSQIPLNYVYTLYYLRYPPAWFQQGVRREIVDGSYQVTKFNRYIFNPDSLKSKVPYGYLTRKEELREDSQHCKTVTYSDEYWEVGMMQAPSATAQ